jgi:hypothetical protein
LCRVQGRLVVMMDARTDWFQISLINSNWRPGMMTWLIWIHLRYEILDYDLREATSRISFPHKWNCYLVRNLIHFKLCIPHHIWLTLTWFLFKPTL